jgi:spermidine synthase
MTLDPNWFTERCDECGSAFSLKLREKLHEERSPYQLIEIYETESFGRLMTLDGFVMLTTRDNFLYHEMMTHPALYTHPAPKRVLIIGGGDCGCLLEVLKHPGIERADLVDIDERVTRVSEKYFPELCASNNDPRASLNFVDGIRWVEDADPGSYDVIVIDSTDPIGQAARLFSEEFYGACRNALSDDGVLIAQTESPLFHKDLIHSVAQRLAGAGFADSARLYFPQCVYPSGWWTATLAVNRDSAVTFREQDAANKGFVTRYYNAGIHRGALAAPEFMEI